MLFISSLKRPQSYFSSIIIIIIFIIINCFSSFSHEC